MRRWRARGYLVILAALAIGASVAVPFLPADKGRDVLAGGLLIGGLAMLVVALTGSNGHDDH